MAILEGRVEKRRNNAMRIRIVSWLIVIAFTFLYADTVTAERIKDISSIHGIRQNQLVGYGLVIGLEGTGDNSKAAMVRTSMSNLLENFGISIPKNDFKLKNVAAVMVTAELPAFARKGSRIDVTVSSMGDADSLYGGTLLLTSLKGIDGNVYALSQGNLLVGGISAGGAGASVKKNFLTVGKIVNGAIVEREVPNSFGTSEELILTLHKPDFTTISRMIDIINSALSDRLAVATDPGTVRIAVPSIFQGDLVSMATFIEGLEITTDDVAKVIVNEKTGTVVIGQNVRISKVAIAHGNLSIEVKTTAEVSQPLPFSVGETVVVPNTSIDIKENNSKLFVVDAGVTIGELVRALNAIGVSPRDLMSIFQALKTAGALKAEIEVM